MIGAWIGIILTLCCGAGTAIAIGCMAETKKGRTGGIIACIVFSLALAGLIFWWLYATEGGARAQKTFKSETTGGLYRVVTVYDMEGEQLAVYKGKFDIEEKQEEGVVKVKFDMDGKRHIIYCSTGTVTIDEVGKEEKNDE